MRGYKVLTHCLRPPIQGGNPIIRGPLPYTLPRVKVDTSDAECAAGWNFTETIESGLRIAGLWPTGYPARVFVVETTEPVIVRGDKRRTSVLTILEEVGDEVIANAINRMSEVFGEWRDEMAQEQISWRMALARPERDAVKVEDGLRQALDIRNLSWTLRKFDNTNALWKARLDWYVGNSLDLASIRYVWNAWVDRATRNATDVRNAWFAGYPITVWGSLAARSAMDALMLWFASRQGWCTAAHDRLTIGLRDAYLYGLGAVTRIDKNILGYALVKP